jgi:PTH1 family peptidyl-tRNA hydrolase
LKLVAGLGNPGSRYQFSRHNIGFLVLDRLADRHGIGVGQRAFGALYGKGQIAGQPVILCKPQRYMNVSGAVVKEFFDYYKMDIQDVIVIHDDLDLPFRIIRIKAGGGPAGHKGLISVIDHLSDADFSRVRLGIGKPQQKEMTESYVLSYFSTEEMEQLPLLIDLAAEMLIDLFASGIQEAMRRYHGKTINHLKEEV